jgi:hypothetical protein
MSSLVGLAELCDRGLERSASSDGDHGERDADE